MLSSTEILNSLNRIRQASDDSERFATRPPLKENDVAAFESRHHITLPGDYRKFLLEIGNGGAGPYYGIYKLGMDDDKPLRPQVLENLSRWFLHQDHWDIPAEFDDPEHYYYSDDIMQGAIPICTAGCGVDYWLVVAGPSAGQIWLDSRSENSGVEPELDDDDDIATFGIWYEAWLQKTETELGLA